MGLHFLQEGEHWTILPYSVIKRVQIFFPIKTYPLLAPPPDRICYKLTHRFPNTSNIQGINILEKHLSDYLNLLQEETYIHEING
jgi:hypothetical protein